jgi:hypothetical protein
MGLKDTSQSKNTHLISITADIVEVIDHLVLYNPFYLLVFLGTIQLEILSRKRPELAKYDFWRCY